MSGRIATQNIPDGEHANPTIPRTAIEPTIIPDSQYRNLRGREIPPIEGVPINEFLQTEPTELTTSDKRQNVFDLPRLELKGLQRLKRQSERAAKLEQIQKETLASDINPSYQDITDKFLYKKEKPSSDDNLEKKYNDRVSEADDIRKNEGLKEKFARLKFSLRLSKAGFEDPSALLQSIENSGMVTQLKSIDDESHVSFDYSYLPRGFIETLSQISSNPTNLIIRLGELGCPSYALSQLQDQGLESLKELNSIDEDVFQTNYNLIKPYPFIGMNYTYVNEGQYSSELSDLINLLNGNIPIDPGLQSKLAIAQEIYDLSFSQTRMSVPELIASSIEDLTLLEAMQQRVSSIMPNNNKQALRVFKDNNLTSQLNTFLRYKIEISSFNESDVYRISELPEDKQKVIFDGITEISEFLEDPEKRTWLGLFQRINEVRPEDNSIREQAIYRARDTFKYRYVHNCCLSIPGLIDNSMITSTSIFNELGKQETVNPELIEELLQFTPDKSFPVYFKSICKLSGINFEKYTSDRNPEKTLLEDIIPIIRSYTSLEDVSQEARYELILDIQGLGSKYLIPENTLEHLKQRDDNLHKEKFALMFSQIPSEDRQHILEALPISADDLIERKRTEEEFFEKTFFSSGNLLNILLSSPNAQELASRSASFKQIMENTEVLTSRIKQLSFNSYYTLNYYHEEFETLAWLSEISEDEFNRFRDNFLQLDTKNLGTFRYSALFYMNKENLQPMLDKVNALNYGEQTEKYKHFADVTANLGDINYYITIIENGNIDAVIDVASSIVDDNTLIEAHQLQTISELAKERGFDPEKFRTTIIQIKKQFSTTTQSERDLFDTRNLKIVNNITNLNEADTHSWSEFIQIFDRFEDNDVVPADRLHILWGFFAKDNREQIIRFVENIDNTQISLNSLAYPVELKEEQLETIISIQNTNFPLNSQTLDITNLSQSPIVKMVSMDGLQEINTAIEASLKAEVADMPILGYLKSITPATQYSEAYIKHSIPFIKQLTENGLIFDLRVDPKHLENLSDEQIGTLVNYMAVINDLNIIPSGISVRDYSDCIGLIEICSKKNVDTYTIANLVDEIKSAGVKDISQLSSYFEFVYPLDSETYNNYISSTRTYCPDYIRGDRNRFNLVADEVAFLNFRRMESISGSLKPAAKFDVTSYTVLSDLIKIGMSDDNLIHIINNSFDSFPLSTYKEVLGAFPNASAEEAAYLINSTASELEVHYSKNHSELSKLLLSLTNKPSASEKPPLTTVFTEAISLLRENPVNTKLLEANTNDLCRLLDDYPTLHPYILNLSSGSTGQLAIKTLLELQKSGVIDISRSEDQDTLNNFVNEIGYFPSTHIFSLFRNFDQNTQFQSSLGYLENIEDLSGVNTKQEFTEKIRILRSELLKSGNIDPSSRLQREILMIEGRYELGRFKRNKDSSGLYDMVDRYYEDFENGNIGETPSYYKSGKINVDIIKSFNISNDAADQITTILGNAREARSIVKMPPDRILTTVFQELANYVRKEYSNIESNEAKNREEQQKAHENNTNIVNNIRSLSIEELESNSDLLKSLGLEDNQGKLLIYLYSNHEASLQDLQDSNKVFTDPVVFNRVISQLQKNGLLIRSENDLYSSNLDLLETYSQKRTTNKYKNIERNLNMRRGLTFELVNSINSLSSSYSANMSVKEIIKSVGLANNSFNEKTEEFAITLLLSIISGYKAEATGKKVSTNNLNNITQKLIWSYILNDPHALNLSYELGDEIEDLVNRGISLRHLNTITELVQEHISEHAIARMPLSKQQKTELRKSFNINPIVQDIENFNKSKAAGTNQYTIMPTRGVLAELSGDMGDACWASRCTDIMRKNPDMTAFTIVEDYTDPLKAKSIGSFLVIRKSINNIPTLILRGLNPRQDIFDQGVNGASFLKEVIKYLEETAERIKEEEGVPHVIIAAPQGSSGAFSNRSSLQTSHQLFFEKTAEQLDEPEAFNGYDITQNIPVRIGQSTILAASKRAPIKKEPNQLYVPLLSSN